MPNLLLAAWLSTFAFAGAPATPDDLLCRQQRAGALPYGPDSACDFASCRNVVVGLDGRATRPELGKNDGFHFVNLRPVLHQLFFRFGARLASESGNSEPVVRPAAQTELCDLGFTHVFAANNTFAPTTWRCRDGRSVRYAPLRWTDGGRAFAEQVIPLVQGCVNALEAGGDARACRFGVHCTNGEHRAGLIATLALMHFCDYSLAQAKEYWLARESDEEPADYFRQMQAFANLHLPRPALSAAAREALCPLADHESYRPLPRCEAR